MKQLELKNSLANSLGRVYGMEFIDSFIEFWQGELRILQYVYQHRNSETMSPSVLSSALHVSRARITAALSALRKKGYIVMEICSEDRRRMRVILTTDGEVFIKKKQEEVERQFDILTNGLGEKNTQELIRLIELSIEVMGKNATNHSETI